MATAASHWFEEAQRQLQLTALWAFWESVARTGVSDNTINEPFEALRYQAWMPGASDLSGEFVRLARQPGAEPIVVLQRANRLWATLWKEDYRKSDQADGPNGEAFRKRFRVSLKAELSKEPSDKVPAAPPSPDCCPFARPMQLASSWSAQALARATLFERPHPPPDDSGGRPLLALGARADEYLHHVARLRDECAHLKTVTNQRLRLVRPFYFRVLRDPDEVPYLERLSHVLSDAEALLDWPRPTNGPPAPGEWNGKRLHWAKSLSQTINELWQIAGATWPPAVILDLVRGHSLSIDHLNRSIKQYCDQANYPECATDDFLEKSDEFDRRWKQLDYPIDEARLHLARAIIQHFELLQQERVVDWPAVGTSLGRLFEGSPVSVELIHERAQAEELPSKCVSNRISLSARSEETHEVGIKVAISRAVGIWKPLVIVRPSGLAEFGEILRKISRELPLAVWQNLVRRFELVLANHSAEQQKSLGKWWIAASNEDRTLLWLLTQQVQINRAASDAMEWLASEYYRILQREGFSFSASWGENSAVSEESLGSTRWIFFQRARSDTDSRDTSPGAGVALGGPDEKWLAPAVYFTVPPPREGEQLIAMSEILHEAIVQAREATTESWSKSYREFALAVAADDSQQVTRSGLEFLTQCFPVARRQTLLGKLCYAVYQYLTDVKQVKVTPSLQLRGPHLEVPRWNRERPPPHVTPKWCSSIQTVGTVQSISAFSDGSRPATWELSCGQLEPAIFEDLVNLPVAPNAGNPTGPLVAELQQFRRNLMEALFRPGSLADAMKAQARKIFKLLSEPSSSDANWFHLLVVGAKEDSRSPAAKWYRALRLVNIPCFPNLDVTSGELTWPSDKSVEHLPMYDREDLPPNSAFAVERYSVHPGTARASISLGAAQPCYEIVKKIDARREVEQIWLRELLGEHEIVFNELRRTTELRMLKRPFKSAEQVLLPVATVLLRAAATIRQRETDETKGISRLGVLDELLGYVRDWGRDFGWEIIPRRAVLGSDMHYSELQGEERAASRIDFSRAQPHGTVQIVVFGVCSLPDGDKAPAATHPELLISAGKPPPSIYELRSLLKEVPANKLADFRQRLMALPDTALQFGQHSEEWVKEGEKLFSDYYESIGDDVFTSMEARDDFEARLRMLLEQGFDLEVRIPSENQMHDNWVEWPPGVDSRRDGARVLPALFNKGDFRCSAKVLG